MNKTKKSEFYQQVTKQFIDALKNGAPPWIRPWKLNTTVPERPVNAVTGRKYSGINICLLWSAATCNGYNSDRWLTFNQASKLGARVRKGQKGTTAILYRRIQVPSRDENGELVIDIEGNPIKQIIRLMRGFTLFNIEQCDGLPVEIYSKSDCRTIPSNWDSHDAAEELLKKTGVTIIHDGNSAVYVPEEDRIFMPPRQTFDSPAGYYSTVLHELTHWTGHTERLNRIGISQVHRQESPEYAFEELIAEIGSAYICADLRIPGELHHEGYVLSWIKLLENDPKAIFNASAKAAEAFSYIFETGNHNSAIEFTANATD